MTAELATGATRCPFCHESVRMSEDAWLVCAACLARHHEECWTEHERCASCACDAALAALRAPASPLAPTGRARLSRPLAASLAGLVLAALAVLAVLVATAAGRSFPPGTIPVAVALLLIAVGGTLGALLVWPPRHEETVPAAEPFVAADGTLDRLRNRLEDVRERRDSSRRQRIANDPTQPA